MRIVSFNTNSIRVRLPQLEAVIKTHAPEIIGIQETKVTDEDFPVDAIAELGYHAEYFGQKTHYGVALLSKSAPSKVVKGLPGESEDAQRRFISGTYNLPGFNDVTVMNGYFPQGENRNHPTKFPNKVNFYKELTSLLKSQFKADQALLLMGDMNIAAIDNDIGIGEDNKKRWLRDGKTSFLPDERQWLQDIMAWGLIDSYRALYPDETAGFSWFDYRSRGFEREPRRGLRIDMILASQPMMDKLSAAGIDTEVRSMIKPSDHCPIWAEFKV